MTLKPSAEAWSLFVTHPITLVKVSFCTTVKVTVSAHGAIPKSHFKLNLSLGSNWLFTVADGIRVGDDLARFHLQNTLVKRPVFGVHGSFLFTNGEMENECTWDFGSLAEDFEFSQDAWRRGFTCGRVHGIVREQSPTTVRDFLKQRRRWYMGIRDIQGVYGLPHLAVNLWTVGVFTLCVTCEHSSPCCLLINMLTFVTL